MARKEAGDPSETVDRSGGLLSLMGGVVGEADVMNLGFEITWATVWRTDGGGRGAPGRC